jgi:uncharacterized protein YdbL (DUF1318 family)
MTRWLRLCSLARPLAALALAGCVAVTINVTFPQEKIDSAAASIEDLVREPAPPANTPGPAGPPRGATPGGADAVGARVVTSGWLAWLGPRAVEAQVPELKTRTPEVMAVVESRRARYRELAAAMAMGCVGESNAGLVQTRPGSGCPPDVAALVAAENKDRMFLYQTLVQQNNMPPGDLPRVQAAFARANRERAPAGAWVQDDGGAWSRK